MRPHMRDPELRKARLEHNFHTHKPSKHPLRGGIQCYDNDLEYNEQLGEEVICVGILEYSTDRARGRSPAHAAHLRRLPTEIDGVPIQYYYQAAFEAYNRLGYNSPMVGGISIGHEMIASGTLGGVVWDKNTHEPLLLSNAHIFCRNQNPMFMNWWIGGDHGDPILQPGPLHGGASYPPAGTLHRWKNIQFVWKEEIPRHRVDAAVAVPTRSFEAEKYYHLDHVSAVRAYVVDPDIDDVLCKDGARTGYREQPLAHKNTTAIVRYHSGYQHGAAEFVDIYRVVQILHSSVLEAERFAAPGDSGSRVWRKSDMRPMGLVFAGGVTPLETDNMWRVTTLIIPAFAIEEELNVRFHKPLSAATLLATEHIEGRHGVLPVTESVVDFMVVDLVRPSVHGNAEPFSQYREGFPHCVNSGTFGKQNKTQFSVQPHTTNRLLSGDIIKGLQLRTGNNIPATAVNQFNIRIAQHEHSGQFGGGWYPWAMSHIYSVAQIPAFYAHGWQTYEFNSPLPYAGTSLIFDITHNTDAPWFSGSNMVCDGQGLNEMLYASGNGHTWPYDTLSVNTVVGTRLSIRALITPRSHSETRVLEPTMVGPVDALFRGVVTKLDNGSQAFFRYRKVGEQDWMETGTEVTISSFGEEFSWFVDDLEPDTLYEVRSVVRDGSSRRYMSDNSIAFRTLLKTPYLLATSRINDDIKLTFHLPEPYGSSSNPWPISNAEELQLIGSGYDRRYMHHHYMLVDDIDWAEHENDSFVPIGYDGPGAACHGFGGVLDGQGYTIYNLKIHKLNSYYIALISELRDGAAVYNLHLDSVDISTAGSTVAVVFVAGIAGRLNPGTVTDCSVSGVINHATTSATHFYTGGIAGTSTSLSGVYRCKNLANITGGGYVGGILGQHSHWDSYDNYNMGNITGDRDVGGLLGRNHRGRVRQCYSNGLVSGTQDVGGLVGSVSDIGNYQDLNNYWNTTTSGQANSSMGTGRNDTQMKQIETFTGWDIALIGNHTNQVWYIDEGNDYPRLRWEME